MWLYYSKAYQRKLVNNIWHDILLTDEYFFGANDITLEESSHGKGIGSDFCRSMIYQTGTTTVQGHIGDKTIVYLHTL